MYNPILPSHVLLSLLIPIFIYIDKTHELLQAWYAYLFDRRRASNLRWDPLGELLHEDLKARPGRGGGDAGGSKESGGRKRSASAMA